ncbi:hypothetical protein [Nonomuraea jiangxiensis]|uniref:Cytochrome P450 n=1 Tax=Nonomuraea jiangxiensis TaxID=633440 RepID=A0A1G8EIM9_9ACTN|nr:hypothetical protein [Nonomuraea jiangxiensis]SDH69768.1 hypothetical protein SAMN05421869_1033 [Nonomuraea jiangxiensis]
MRRTAFACPLPIAVIRELIGVQEGMSANYDPRRFDGPGRLDLTRERGSRRESHVGFGHGPHYCLAHSGAEIPFYPLFLAKLPVRSA